MTDSFSSSPKHKHDQVSAVIMSNFTQTDDSCKLLHLLSQRSWLFFYFNNVLLSFWKKKKLCCIVSRGWKDRKGADRQSRRDRVSCDAHGQKDGRPLRGRVQWRRQTLHACGHGEMLKSSRLHNTLSFLVICFFAPCVLLHFLQLLKQTQWDSMWCSVIVFKQAVFALVCL